MKPLLIAATLVLAAGMAEAKIPLVNATCLGNIEVHADEGGPIYINGQEGKLEVFRDSYYKAKHDDVTISLMINPDGTPDVSYIGKHRANGICQVASGGHHKNKHKGAGCPNDVSEAERYLYPDCN